MNKLYYTYSEICETIHDDYGKDGPYTGRREDRLDWTLNCLFMNRDIAKKIPITILLILLALLKKIFIALLYDTLLEVPLVKQVVRAQ
jgi:hypothetical protein